MKKVFIHISDLHVAVTKKPGKKDANKNSNRTYLCARDDKDNDCYISEFCDYIKKQYPISDSDFYLLVSGDIADYTLKVEYEYAQVFLKQILEKLNVDKKKVLIVPGNHDVDWNECERAARMNTDSELLAYEHFEAKYRSFKRYFYDSFFQGTGKTFDVNKQIVDYLAIDDERILFVGINTNYKIEYGGGTGAVNVEAFNVECNELFKKYPDYSKVAVFHHNLCSDSEEGDNHYGSWEKNDWISFVGSLKDNRFDLVLFGNEHTRASSRVIAVGEVDRYQSDCGSFALHDEFCTPSFKIYEPIEYYDSKEDVKKQCLKQHLFQLIDKGRAGIRSFGRWIRLDNKQVKEPDEFPIRITQIRPIDQRTIDSFPPSSDEKDDTDENNQETKDNHSTDSNDTYEGSAEGQHPSIIIEDVLDKDFRDTVMGIIKLEQLYHPGHFHWGKSSRSHNWIDTISVLNNHKYISLIQSNIRKLVLEIENHTGKFDAIIGVGMEGNIMSTQLLLEDIPYAYLPYTYRYEEFNDFERSICLDNSDGRYKNVLIITDVVNKGRMLSGLIKDKGASFFANVTQIHVVSLFYTGRVKKEKENEKDEKKKAPIMPVGLEEIKDKTISYYSLVQLEVGDCPYKDEEVKDCTIYKDHICEVYKFYDEK